MTLDPKTGEWLLPDVDLVDPDRAWSLWTLLEAIEWKYPPDVIERQDATVMHDLMTISATSTLVKRMLEELKRPAAKPR